MAAAVRLRGDYDVGSLRQLVHGELVYIGPAGTEWAAKGWIGAFRISDGEQARRCNIVPDDGEPGANTCGQIQQRANTAEKISA